MKLSRGNMHTTESKQKVLKDHNNKGYAVAGTSNSVWHFRSKQPLTPMKRDGSLHCQNLFIEQKLIKV